MEMKEFGCNNEKKILLIHGAGATYDADIRHTDAALSGIESIYKRVEADNKKYIFRATGKFSQTNSNGRRCILHFQIHNGVSRITRLF